MRQGPHVGTNNYDLDLGVWPNLLKTITMLRTFELWVLELIHFTWIFVVTKSFHVYQHFYPVTLTFEIDIFSRNINLSHKFWTVCDRGLVFHMNIIRYMTFPWIPTVFDLMTFTLELDLLFEKLLALLRTFEMWVLVFMQMTWIFLVAMPFRGYQHFVYSVTLFLESY